MKIEIECNDLPSALKALMVQRNMTYRQLSRELGMNVATVWRTINKPNKPRVLDFPLWARQELPE